VIRNVLFWEVLSQSLHRDLALQSEAQQAKAVADLVVTALSLVGKTLMPWAAVGGSDAKAADLSEESVA
jgi:hypothetical protein